MGAVEDAEPLMDRGFDLLHRNNAQEAYKIGKTLQRRRFSGGFELQALALNKLNRRKAAIKVLERGVGVRVVPDVWLLWQLLGNYRSDEGDFEGAYLAYQSALGCDCDNISVIYNLANALVRDGKWDEAEAQLRKLIEHKILASAEPSLGRYIVLLFEEILLNDGRDDEAELFIEEHADVLARAATEDS